jgi:phytoene/squalene synthetase
MKAFFDNLSYEISELTTKRYSTSFSLGISLLHKNLHKPIYSIYGFVRFADEIVDSFHGFDKENLLADFKKQTYEAITAKISLNPILNSFQWVVNTYNIPLELIETFLHSMEMDLEKQVYSKAEYDKYILGSAEVVGLMCLCVFVDGKKEAYKELKPAAMKLGSAFQKINFLRDLSTDFQELGRTYFPGLSMDEFNAQIKSSIEADIEMDFKAGFEGIKGLPKNARLGVYLAYRYYFKLFKKIKATSIEKILKERIRIPNTKKISILMSAYLKNQMNRI